MKRHFLKFMSVFIIALFFILWGCNSEDNPVEPADTPMVKPTNLKAYSKSNTQVGLTWTKSVDATNTNFGGYTLKIKSGTAVVSTISVTKDTAAWVVSNLTEGTIYDFILYSVTLKGTLSTDSVSVKWSPAKRLNDQGSGKEIKIYETASPSFPSGLDFYNATTMLPIAVSMGTTKPEAATADLYVKTATVGNNLEITNPNKANANYKNTKFSSEIGSVSSLDDPNLVPPAESTYGLDVITIVIDPQTSNRIYWAKTAEGNYVRFIVSRDPSDNSLVWGTSPDRYLSFKISYQTTPGVIYSKTSSK